MTQEADRTLRWAWQLMDSLNAAGVRTVVISPGSRSTPLALAAMRHPKHTAEMIVDERSAAFFALGIAKAANVPVALIATSGSAIANWYPAVVEADMGRVPLVLVSADRPPELQDCGANQTTDQLRLFGIHVRAFHQLPPAENALEWLTPFAARVVGASLWPLPGPVHINVPLREPLVSSLAPALVPSARAPQDFAGDLEPGAEAIETLSNIISAGMGAIICGPDGLGQEFNAAVVALARKLAVPIFADVLNGLRFGAHAVREVLAHPDQVARSAPSPRWILRFGGTPISRTINEWMARSSGCAQIVVTALPRVFDPAGTATHIVRASPARLCARLTPETEIGGDWLDFFFAADRAACVMAEQLCEGEIPFEGAIIRRLLAELPEGTPVFLGNSLAVRATGWFAGQSQKQIRFFGNRGMSGIDGNISTAFGIAATLGRAVTIIGDLACLHDLNALVLGAKHPLTVLVLDNGGGGIFDHLAQSSLPEFEEGWIARQEFDAVHAARAFGLGATHAESVTAAVSEVLSSLEARKSVLVRVPIDRRYSLERCRSLFASGQQGA